MKYLLTICSNDKDWADGLLPARQRYLNPFMDRVIAEGERINAPVLILSGQFGLLSPNDPIPYYDYTLTKNKVEKMALMVTEQLKNADATEITAYIKKPRTTNQDWENYYSLIERSAQAANVELEFAQLQEPTEPHSETTHLR